MCRFLQEDDSDMKIADFSEPDRYPLTEGDGESRRLFAHKDNGNADKARVLGASVVREMITGDTNAKFGVKDDGLYPYQPQIRLLMTFAAVTGLQTDLPDDVLSRTALNAFYDTLKKAFPAFYEDIDESGAFTFFYLAYRRGGDVERNMGRAFAALCGADGDEVFAELGETLYSQGRMLVKKQAEETDFLPLSE